MKVVIDECLPRRLANALIGDKTGVKKISFTLLSLPLFLAGQIDRLLREHF